MLKENKGENKEIENLPDQQTLSEFPEFPEPSSPFSGPLKIILALFLILLLVLWIFPSYGLKQNPEPRNIPSLEDLNLSSSSSPFPQIDSLDPRDYIQTTPGIKQIADKIVTLSCPSPHRVCYAKAIFYFVQKNFFYVNDPLYHEYYKTPQETLTSRASDCDDFAILTASLLRSVGFLTRFVQVPGHLYLQVKIPEAISSYKDKEGWINLDPTCSSCGFGEISYSYAQSDKQFLD